MNNDAIINWILKHPDNYPGRHLDSQPRTFQAYKPLDPRSQFIIVLRATGQYLKEKLTEGYGVNLRHFGAFCFEVFSDTVKPAQLSNFDITDDLGNQRMQRKHVHQIRPCFIPDGRLKASLSRYPGKQQIDKPKSQCSVYQKGFHMIFCNPTPIALACYLSKETVEDIHNSFIRAVKDLTQLGKSIEVALSLCTISIKDRNLSYSYNDSFTKSLNKTSFQLKMRTSDKPTKQHWTEEYKEKWSKSTLNSLLKQPDHKQSKEQYEKGLALKILSLDLNTAQKTSYSKVKK